GEVAARRRRRRCRRLERQCVVAEADPGVAALVAALRVDLQRRAFAAMLVFGIEREAVPSNLAGEAADEYLAVLHQTRVDRRANPVPARRVAGVRVAGDPFHRRLRVEVAIAGEEPQAVLLDRAAERGTVVVRLNDPGRLRQADGAEIVGQVMPARP